MNRVEELIPKMGGSPNSNMALLLSNLSPSTIVPQPNKYYVFVYKAKTPNITYDQNPLILCGNVYPWGFNGYNVHWPMIRQYTWNEVLSNIYELSESEFDIVRDFNLAKFRRT